MSKRVTFDKVLKVHQVKFKLQFKMKKIYLSICAVLAGLGMSAQVDVTFNVDMTNETVPAEGVHIAGNFADPNYDGTVVNPAYVNWSPSAIAMTDVDMDGVYSITMSLLPNRYEFKFINGNDWPFNESVPGACQVGNGNSNREINITAATEYNVCYGSCAPCGEKTVRFRVDMSQQAGVNPLGVHVAGDFQSPIFIPADGPLSDPDGDGIWEGYYNVGTMSTIEYKFINGNDWIYPNESVTDLACGSNGGNRVANLTDLNTVLPAFCFGSCDPCTQPTSLTLMVDMSNETVSPNGVHVAGSFQSEAGGAADWTPGDMLFALTDANSDGIYEGTWPCAPGNYAFKFVNGNDWGGANNSPESVPGACANAGGDRPLEVTGDFVSIQFCFNQCLDACVPNPDPADVTFRVNTNYTGFTLAPEGLFVIANFTNPAWQGGATQMTDSNLDGVYEATLNVSGTAEFQYKFVNGDVTVTANEENVGIQDCGVGNGIGGFNRTHVRSGQPEVLAIVCFDSCQDCIIGVSEVEVVSDLKVFPNPTSDLLNINFSSTTAQQITIFVTNSLGQTVKTERLGTVNGARNLKLDVSNLSTGIYSIQLSNGLATQTIRVAVK
jgi:hypothetical protein